MHMWDDGKQFATNIVHGIYRSVCVCNMHSRVDEILLSQERLMGIDLDS
jgi:hypothetical protein